MYLTWLFSIYRAVGTASLRLVSPSESGWSDLGPETEAVATYRYCLDHRKNVTTVLVCKLAREEFEGADSGSRYVEGYHKGEH